MSARVLGVDDVGANVRLLEAILTANYFQVTTASGGLECLAKMDAESPDIVLLDVMMPGIDGFEVCRRIKSNPLMAHIPVVMVTALGRPSDRVTGLEAGADDFLTKPVDDIALLARVRTQVRRSTGRQLRLPRVDRPADRTFISSGWSADTLEPIDLLIEGQFLRKFFPLRMGSRPLRPSKTPWRACARAISI
jgi:two-component system cell cycle response regulator